MNTLDDRAAVRNASRPLEEQLAASNERIAVLENYEKQRAEERRERLYVQAYSATGEPLTSIEYAKLAEAYILGQDVSAQEDERKKFL